MRRPSAPASLWIPALLLVLTCIGVRIGFLSLPLERDEGEYAYVAQRILDGAAPYQDAYSLKMPGIHLVYAGILGTLGSSVQAIHVGLLLANLLGLTTCFLLARRWVGDHAAVLAAAILAFLSVGSPVQGVFANAEHFVLPGILGGWWLLHRGGEPGSRDRFLAGIALGLAVVTKQHAAPFLLAGFAWMLLQPGSARARLSRGLTVAGGAAVPFLAVVTWLAVRGSLDAATFWTVTYAVKYVASLPSDLALMYLRIRGGDLVLQNWPVMAAAVAGLVLVARNPGPAGRAPWILFALASLAAVSIGGYFRPHYFVLALPLVALLAATSLVRLRPPLVRGLLVGAVLFLGVLPQRAFLFGDEENALTTCYGTGVEKLFAASPEIARYLEENSSPDDTIAIFGSEPQLLFYSQRRSATGYIYVYPLMEDHDLVEQMQQEMIDEVRAAEPRLLLFMNLTHSWVATEDSDRRIMRWAQQYWRKHYQRVGVVEFPRDAPTRFFWDDDAAARLPQGQEWVAVFRRLPGT